MFGDQVATDTSSLVVVNVPIRLDDVRFNSIVRDTSLYVSSHHPHTSSIVVRGNGCAYPHHTGSRFLVQASCLFALPPSDFPKLQGGKSVKITPLFPLQPSTTALEPVNTKNGAGSAKEQKRELKQTKAVTPSRQKKPARRVVVRQNNKQAN